MKKIILTIFTVCLLSGYAAASTLHIDLSNAELNVSGQETMRLNHVNGLVLDGNAVQGNYWVDFQWDPENFVFVPVDAGEEVPSTGHTWSWLVYDRVSSTFQYDMTSGPEKRLFYVSFKRTGGSPFVCPGTTEGPIFIQGNNQFGLSSSHPDDNNAQVTFSGGFDGCDFVYAGQTVTGTISAIPAWFNFSEPFKVAFGTSLICYLHMTTCSDGPMPMTVNPDGTIQIQ